jgi:hypothetical protein
MPYKTAHGKLVKVPSSKENTSTQPRPVPMMVGKVNGLWVKSFSTPEKPLGRIVIQKEPEYYMHNGHPTNALMTDDFTTKGDYLGLCNRSACLRPKADWYNVGSLAYYCEECARMINMDGCRRYGHPDLCFKGRKEELGVDL